MIPGVGTDHARPPTDQDTKPTDDQPEITQRVYAPASERVPVAPVPGHRDMIEHTDTSTPERVAAGLGSEPAFARVTRPSTATPPTTSTWDYRHVDPPTSGSPKLWLSIGASWLTVLGTGVGVWLFLRWRRERNRPINRFRRQAKQTASVIRKRMPSSREEVARPALSLAAAVLSSLVVVWQQAQARRKEADKLVSDVNWQKQLNQLKKRWSPRRVELEKISISRH
jgi:hypothetical protein